MNVSVLSSEHAGTAIVVVNYKTAAKVLDLYNNAKSRIGENIGKVIFIIIDNASGVDEASFLKNTLESKSDVVLILSEINHGYSRGNNIGLKRAADLKLKYSMIVNSDISFTTTGFLKIFCENIERLERCGLIGPQILLPNGSEQPPIRKGTLINSVFALFSPVYRGVQPVYATTGCCVFGATATFQLIGMLDEMVFLYREEWMLAERLHARGLYWYYLPSVQVIHHHERKTVPLSRLLTHKMHEFRSTIYFFKQYKRSSFLGILTYRILFYLRLALYLVYFGAKGVFTSKSLS